MEGLLTVLDFETTSLENPYAIEIGMIALDDNLDEVSRYESVIKPPIEVSKKILGMTRLTSNQVSKAPTFEDLWPDIHPYLSNRIFVAHYAHFENKVLYKEFMQLGIEEYIPRSLCTHELSKKILQELPKHSLEFLTSHLKISHPESHQALGDVIPTVELLKKLSQISTFPYEEIQRMRRDIVTIPTPQDSALPPLVRLRSEPESHEVNAIVEHLRNSSKIRISITGTPEIGKEELAQKFQEVGLIYDKGPIVNSMALVIRCNYKPGESKVQQAKAKGIPVISEELAVQLITELKRQ